MTPKHSRAACAALFAVFALGCFSPLARAQSVFIPAVQRVDMVHDLARGILYITNGNEVLRYSTATNQFLSSYSVNPGGQSLKGIDLSPDGNTLAVADSSFGNGYNGVWVIDIPTGAIRHALFPLAFYEAGTFAVAFGGDGACLVSSNFNGSGWVPLRRFDPATGAVSQIATVSQSSMVSASGDGSVIAVAESNSSDGPVDRYRVADGNWLSRSGYTYGTGWFNFEIGASHDGSQYSVPTYDGTFIFDADLLKTGAMIGGYATAGQPIGVAYHPFDDLVYYAWSGTSQVRAYNTKTLTQVAAYDVGQGFVWNGNNAFYDGRTRLSRDGSLLFVTVGDPYYTGSPALGVRMVRLYSSLTANDVSASTNEDTSAAITLSGSIGNGGTLGYQLLTQPAHGSLTGTAPNLTYTPSADYNGSDSFTYCATYGPARSAPATVTIAINAVNDAPSFTAGSNVTVNEDSGAYAAAWASGISPGPSDEAGQQLSFIVSCDNSALFSAQPAIDASGTLRFTSAPGAYGIANVTVRLHDDGGTANGGVDTSGPQSFTITVAHVNHTPIAVDDSAITRKGTVVKISVLANDSDPDGDAIHVTGATQPAHGTAAVNRDGTISYTPAKAFQGTDSFTYVIADPSGATATAIVTVSVQAGKK